MDDQFTCTDCGQTKPIQHNGGTGYATTQDGKLICYECCASRDCEEMEKTGKAVFYLVPRKDAKPPYAMSSDWQISNWPGTLRFTVTYKKTGRHNIAGKRHDVWFKDQRGQRWHGVNIGDNDLCRCKRLKVAHR